MSRGRNIWRALWVTAGLLSVAEIVFAEDTQQVATAPSPAAAEETEAKLFFERYKLAAKLAQQNQIQEATVVMDLLVKNLSRPPWLEIALLKHAQLAESRSPSVAMEDYTLLLKRLERAPYYQGDVEHARSFRVSLQGSVERGINRMRLRKVRDALSEYLTRHGEYPESLARLSIMGFIEMEDIHDSKDRRFRYIPTGMRQSPFISYHNYELETIPGEPFAVTAPRIDGTSAISEKPKKFAALIRVPGRTDAMRVVEDQNLEGYLIGAIAEQGVIACTPDRVLVLPVP